MEEKLLALYNGYWKFLDYGGWHRVLAIFVFFAVMLSFFYVWGKIKDFLSRVLEDIEEERKTK